MATAQEIAAEEFSAVVTKHRPQIFRFLLSSTRDVDLAETLTQECFLKAHRNWGSFRGESSAMTWLMRIAINLQKDHWRNRRMQFWRQTQSQCGGPGRGQRVAAQRRTLGGAAVAGAGSGWGRWPRRSRG